MRAPRLSRFAAPLAWALLAAPVALLPHAASAQFGVDISVRVAPPPLPVYVQPPLPGLGYIWTPGYWDYAQEAGYYWVPGTWVLPPTTGLLWTPGYWGFNNGLYVFNRGYWGPHVGFYGGINYGYGYGGDGFQGGEWRGNSFAYNRAVNNFGSVHVTNVYERTVVNDRTVNRVSFNGPNGVAARPSPAEEAFAREQHVRATELQQQHERVAGQDPRLRAAVNRGNPAIAATARPAELRGPGVVAARPAEPALSGAPALRRANEPPRNPASNPPLVAHETAPRPAAGPAAHPVPRPYTQVAPRQEGGPAAHPVPRPSAPVMHGPAMPQQRFNVTRPASAPPVPHPGREGEPRH